MGNISRLLLWLIVSISIHSLFNNYTTMFRSLYILSGTGTHYCSLAGLLFGLEIQLLSSCNPTWGSSIPNPFPGLLGQVQLIRSPPTCHHFPPYIQLQFQNPHPQWPIFYKTCCKKKYNWIYTLDGLGEGGVYNPWTCGECPSSVRASDMMEGGENITDLSPNRLLLYKERTSTY